MKWFVRYLLRIIFCSLVFACVHQYAKAETLYSPASPGAFACTTGANNCSPSSAYATPEAACAAFHNRNYGWHLTGPNTSGVYVCVNDIGTQNTNLVTTWTCPTGYTRDTAKVPTDAQACSKESGTPPPSPCADLAGQVVHVMQTCAIVRCPSGFTQVTIYGVPTADCASGEEIIPIDQPDPINYQGCVAHLVETNLMPRPYLASIVGQTSGTMDCDVTYAVSDVEASTENPAQTPTTTPTVGTPTSPDGNLGTSPDFPGLPGSGGSTGGGGDADGDGDVDGDDSGVGGLGPVSPITAPAAGDPASWWQSSYPNGLPGIWQEKVVEIQNSALGDLVQDWGIPEQGQCPSWTFNFWRMSTFELEPPCYIWPILRGIFLFSTALLCRRLIFGG